MVPTPRRELLATPYGLLLNELSVSPSSLVSPLLKLADLAANLDVGTVRSTTVTIILYVSRLVARVDGYMSLLVDLHRGDDPCARCPLRHTLLSHEAASALQEGQRAIRAIFRDKLHPLFEEWLGELRLEASAHSSEEGEAIDESVHLACRIHAHLLLLHRNIRYDEYTYDVASTLSSSFIFLSTRHTWNKKSSSGAEEASFDIPEHELFGVLMAQRRNLVCYVRSLNHPLLCRLMEATVRVTADTGARADSASLGSVSVSQWAYVKGVESAGRFTVSAPCAIMVPVLASDEPVVSAAIAVVDSSVDMGISVDLQTAQLTFKSSHMQALETAIANDGDVQTIFGGKRMQASVVQSTDHRKWVHLVGR